MKLDSLITAPWNENQQIVKEETVEVTDKYVGNDGIMTLKGMLDVMQECAHEHLSAVNLSVEKLMEKGMMLFVTRISCKMSRMPRKNEVLQTKTWTLPERRAGLLRYHTMDVGNERVIDAVSQWVCVDINTRRLISSQGFVDAWSAPFAEMANGCPAPKKLRENCEFTSQNEIIIDENRLDFYGHVNNSEYASFIGDLRPNRRRRYIGRTRFFNADQKFFLILGKIFKLRPSFVGKLGKFRRASLRAP